MTLTIYASFDQEVVSPIHSCPTAFYEPLETVGLGQLLFLFAYWSPVWYWNWKYRIPSIEAEEIPSINS
jgi:hypothetical protein